MTSPSVPLRRAPAPALPTIPVRAVAPFFLFAGVLVALLYFLFVDQGATQVLPGMWLHEFAHDGRHLFGFPCH